MLLNVIQDGMVVLPFFCVCDAFVSIFCCCGMKGLVGKIDAFNIKFCHCIDIISC